MTQQSKYGFLKDVFKYETFQLTDVHPFAQQVRFALSKNRFNDEFEKYLVNAIIEKETDQVVKSSLDLNSNPQTGYFKKFEFCLNQLPSSELNDICLLFDMIDYSQGELLPEVFQFPKHFPSQIAGSLLSQTYGLVLYQHQFFTLLKVANPQLYYNEIDHYRKAWGKRQNEENEKLKRMYLPDGQNIYELLTWVFHKNANSFLPCYKGTLYPNYEEAISFQKTIMKYS